MSHSVSEGQELLQAFGQTFVVAAFLMCCFLRQGLKKMLMQVKFCEVIVVVLYVFNNTSLFVNIDVTSSLIISRH